MTGLPWYLRMAGYRLTNEGEDMTRKPLIYTADAVRVDSDEQGFSLVIDTDEGDKLYVNIHSVALEFYDSVRREMRGWVAEADMARAAVAAGVSLEEYTGRTDEQAGPDYDLARDIARGK